MGEPGTEPCATCGHPRDFHEGFLGPVECDFDNGGCWKGCQAFSPGAPVGSGTSNTRRCAECHDPMTLGKRDCQTCGASSWEWIDPTMTDAEMKRRVIANAVGSGEGQTETFEDELPAHIAESMKDPEYAAHHHWLEWLDSYTNPRLNPAARRYEKSFKAGFHAGRGQIDEALRKAKADALREAADEARIHSVSCPEPDHCNDRRLCAIHNETTADWLMDRADRIENGEQP